MAARPRIWYNTVSSVIVNRAIRYVLSLNPAAVAKKNAGSSKIPCGVNMNAVAPYSYANVPIASPIWSPFPTRRATAGRITIPKVAARRPTNRLLRRISINVYVVAEDKARATLPVYEDGVAVMYPRVPEMKNIVALTIVNIASRLTGVYVLNCWMYAASVTAHGSLSAVILDYRG